MAFPKTLIGYASAGHGHEKAAKAVYEACSELTSKESVSLIDTIKVAPGGFGEFYKQTYLWQIKHVPWAWGAFYYSLDVRFVYFFIRFVRRALNFFTMQKLQQDIVKEKPDIIIAAHFTLVEVADHLKKKGLITSKLIVIVTDYYPHYIWTAPSVDAYAVAAQETKTGLIARGVPENKIEVHGIPIEKKFSIPLDRAALLHAHGLSLERFTVLVTSGGEGIGDLRDLVQKILAIDKNVQVLAVCGTNEALRARMNDDEKKNPCLKVFGFVTNMHELMEMTDIVVGKGGGLTITESFSKARPVVLFKSVPGQEARNVLFVKAHGYGFEGRSMDEVVSIVARLYTDRAETDRVRARVQTIAKPHAATEIAKQALHVAGK